MGHLIWLCLLLVSATQASPIPEDAHEITARENENIHITTGESARDRTIFTVLSLVCMMVLSFLLGARVRQLRRSLRARRNLMSLLLVFMCIFVICSIIISAVMVAGQGLYTYELCSAGTWVCVIFYITIKGTVYTSMTERIRIVRAPFVTRSKDKIYWFCMITAGVLFSSISINAFVFRATELRPSDGRCRFGIQGVASFPTLAVNLFTNLVLTSVFFYLLRPIVKPHATPSTSGPPVEPSPKTAFWGPHPNESAVQRNIRIVLWKSIIGSLLIEIPMAANMIQFIITKGEEPGMICLTICMIDVVWDCLVVYWLTFGSSEAERSLASMPTQTSSRATLRSQESDLLDALEQAEIRDLKIIKAPDSAYAPPADFPEDSRTHSTAGAPALSIAEQDGVSR